MDRALVALDRTKTHLASQFDVEVPSRARSRRMSTVHVERLRVACGGKPTASADTLIFDQARRIWTKKTSLTQRTIKSAARAAIGRLALNLTQE